MPDPSHQFLKRTHIDDDETVIFFPTYAYRPAGKPHWIVHVHGWIFDHGRGSELRKVLMKLLLRFLKLSRNQVNAALEDGRAKGFVVGNERGKSVAIRMGERVHRLSKSRGNGHFQGTLELTEADIRYLLDTHPADCVQLAFQAVTRAEDPRRFNGTVHLIPDQGMSIISDIDDTIKISEVPNRRMLIENTFLHKFQAVPGMAQTYTRLAQAGAVFHYVSSSPWQLYSPLASFLETEGFPSGPFHLRSMRWRGATLGEIFATRGRSKWRTIQRLIRHFPNRRFILVGDSGEKDPKIYAKAARKFPQQVQLICIREVTPINFSSRRYRRLLQAVPRDRWHFFKEATEFAPRIHSLLEATAP